MSIMMKSKLEVKDIDEKFYLTLYAVKIVKPC